MRNDGHSDNSSHDSRWEPTGVVLIWWSETRETEDSNWEHIKQKLVRIIRRLLLGDDNRTETEDAPLKEVIRSFELDTRSDMTQISYCTSDWNTVRSMLIDIIHRDGRVILIIPLIFISDIPDTPLPPVSSLDRHIKRFSADHPDREILFIAPHTDHEHIIDIILTRIRHYAPQSIELLNDIVKRIFYGNWALFTRFMETLQSVFPEDSVIAIRGSAVTGSNWLDGGPFDAGGKGTSDLDIALIGDRIMAEWNDDAFSIPGINTLPLTDATPHVAPGLEPVRKELQRIIGRPVHFQSMPVWYLELRYYLLGQPYVLLN